MKTCFVLSPVQNITSNFVSCTIQSIHSWKATHCIVFLDVKCVLDVIILLYLVRKAQYLEHPGRYTCLCCSTLKMSLQRRSP